jgi:hypothetical protein
MQAFLNRRIIVIVLVLAALLPLSVLSGLVREVAAQSEQESVTGHAEFVNLFNNHLRYSLSAIRHRDGSVSGEVEEHAETAAGVFIRRGHGTVTCFTINGNIARIGGTVDRSSASNLPPGTEFFLTVIDNGEGANDPPDMATSPASGSIGVAARHCTNGFDRPIFTIDRGNIQVRPSGF